MIRNNVHHLPVLEGGRLCGMITNHDLMMLQGASPISVVREIEDQQDLDGLCRAARAVDGMISVLLEEGAGAGNLTRVITEINDRLVRKALELVGNQFGPAPVAWCWIVFGSEGRREQTFKTDQDNAIVYADPRTKSRRVWRGSGSQPLRPRSGTPSALWFPTLPGWLHGCEPGVVSAAARLEAHLLLLGREPRRGGGAALADPLRLSPPARRRGPRRAVARAPGGRHRARAGVLGFLANQIVKNPPPLGFLHRFVVEKEGEHKDLLNLKLKAIAPIVDLARLFALEKGTPETGTLDRLRALRGQNTIVGRYGEELEQAFEFLMLLRIHHQHAQAAAGLEPDNFVDPDKLSALEQKPPGKPSAW